MNLQEQDQSLSCSLFSTLHVDEWLKFSRVRGIGIHWLRRFGFEKLTFIELMFLWPWQALFFFLAGPRFFDTAKQVVGSARESAKDWHLLDRRLFFPVNVDKKVHEVHLTIKWLDVRCQVSWDPGKERLLWTRFRLNLYTSRYHISFSFPWGQFYMKPWQSKKKVLDTIQS